LWLRVEGSRQPSCSSKNCFVPMHDGVFGTPLAPRWIRNVEPPSSASGGGEHVGQRRTCLASIPRHDEPRRSASSGDVLRVPEDQQVVHDAGHRSGATNRIRGLVLRILEAEMLFDVMKRHFEAPTARKTLENETSRHRSISAEERFVGSVALGIADDDDLHWRFAQRR